MTSNKPPKPSFFRTFFDFSGALKDPEWVGTKIKPILSMKSTRILTFILGGSALYISLVSEYDDKGSERDTITKDLRLAHDRAFQNYLGIDIREKFRNFEKMFRSGFKNTSPVVNLSEEEISKLNTEQQIQIRKEIERKKIEIEQDNQNYTRIVKELPKVYSSEEERIQDLIQKSKSSSILLSNLAEKEFERLNFNSDSSVDTGVDSSNDNK